jgi:D-alanyl-lipoteichoic acid acyltransferase DltB (MBOAT superfamily)
MLFNSWAFVFFFVIVYLAYLRLDRVGQNRLLLASGLFFYGSFDWRFLFLLLGTSGVDYCCGLAMAKATTAGRRRAAVMLAIGTNLATLGFFKYYDFFVASLVTLGRTLGVELPLATLNIVLPVGISFYTFQEMSYVVDVYRRDVEPCRSLRDYVVYVTFFPQLVAGPIGRASHLIRQVVEPRVLTWPQVRNGLWLCLVGYFQKVVVADNAAVIADHAFDVRDANGPGALLGIYAFALQIYGDFAGYSNIARGTAALMGFDLTVNFRRPYFATSPSDFWRRWHISLSTWLRDYLYIPLGGNRRGSGRTYVNLMLTMLLGGLWHGARWKFVVWGLYHGLLLALFRALPVRIELPQAWRMLLRPVGIVAMFHVTCLGWLFFRCNSLRQAWTLCNDVVARREWSEQARHGAMALACLGAALLLLDVAAAVSEQMSAMLARLPLRAARWYARGETIVRLAAAATMLGLMYEIGVRQGKQFIYVQF